MGRSRSAPPQGSPGRPAAGRLWRGAFGPTAQAGTASETALVMAAFALGAALPPLTFGTVARTAPPQLRRRRATAGGWGSPALGGVLTLLGLATLKGLDRRMGVGLTASLPAGWLGLITRL